MLNMRLYKIKDSQNINATTRQSPSLLSTLHMRRRYGEHKKAHPSPTIRTSVVAVSPCPDLELPKFSNLSGANILFLPSATHKSPSDTYSLLQHIVFSTVNSHELN
ncbi:hypothetical protein M3Y97_00353900 [Aphelenchoides bicaudatus]|nr:hypothetical protein M3Y97_00353900 [Aphelenchoides bicaudatus]